VSVVAAILADDGAAVPETVERLRRQVYDPARIVVVGAGGEGRRVADREQVDWIVSVPSLLKGLEPSVTHLWLVRAGALPRPDALQALVVESERADAAVAGSKLVRPEDPERLVSVGIATDVFGVPYSGLDSDEIDHGQYDVVRDVAAMAGASMLIRRDLARGVGGPDPALAPQAAAVDLCQRARLRGARVVVVPSSEVLYPEKALRAEPWREEAGRIRAMLKAYSLLTLIWAVPAAFLIGVIEGLVAPFLGRWTLFSWLRAWLWNLWRLPSTIRSRLAARAGKAVGDAELFRFQLRGSAKLKSLVEEIGDKLRARLSGDDRLNVITLGRDLRQPAFVVGALTVGFVLLATRAMWGNGWPAVGYSLPLPESGTAALGAYAGGWNPAGFGSVAPLPPFIGLAGLVQVALFDSPALTSAVLTLAAFLSGVWGTSRLVRTWGIEAVPGMLAGTVLMAGPATRAIAAGTGVPTLLALGVLPWALRVPLTRWPAGWVSRLGRIAAAGWVTALLAVLDPPLIVVPAGLLLLWALLNPREGAAWRAVAVAVLGAGLAVPVLLPWLAAADIEHFLTSGSAYWEPGVVLPGAVTVALVAALISAPERLGVLAIWGGLAGAAGAFLARSADLGLGREVELLGLALVSLGSALVVAVTLEAVRRVDLVSGWRRVVGGVGGLGALAIVITVTLVILPGRAGLPQQSFGSALGFTVAGEGDPAMSRILLVGPADTLPGDSRRVRGADYRVVSAPMPAMWEAWLAEPLLGDQMFEEVLESLIDGETKRAGAALAPFGVRWIIVMGETPLESVFEAQFDLTRLEGASNTSYLVDAEDAVRAMTGSGQAWARDGTGYRGEPESGQRVLVGESASGRWEPGPWSQSSWANEVAADQGTARFRPYPGRRTQAAAALGIFTFLVLASGWTRRRRRS
jgi:hypothetical protein